MKVQKEILLPMRSPSLNQWKNKHWAVYKKIRDKWRHALSAVLSTGDHQGKKRYITVVVYQDSRKNFFDYDNLSGGFKPVLDVIKGLGWIYDDTKNWVNVRYRQRTVGEDDVREVSTRISLHHPGECPVLFLCADCLDFVTTVQWSKGTNREGEQFDGGISHLLYCRCGQAAKYALQLNIWELDDGRGEKTRKKTLQAGATREEAGVVHIPRSPQHRITRKRKR